MELAKVRVVREGELLFSSAEGLPGGRAGQGESRAESGALVRSLAILLLSEQAAGGAGQGESRAGRGYGRPADSDFPAARGGQGTPCNADSYPASPKQVHPIHCPNPQPLPLAPPLLHPPAILSVCPQRLVERHQQQHRYARELERLEHAREVVWGKREEWRLRDVSARRAALRCAVLRCDAPCFPCSAGPLGLPSPLCRVAHCPALRTPSPYTQNFPAAPQRCSLLPSTALHLF